MSAISFSGLASGLDTASMVRALMRLERLPIERIERGKEETRERQGVVQELNGLLGKLRDASAALFGSGALSAMAATSSDATVATARADATATSGSYELSVTALAQAHTLASAAGPSLVEGEVLDISVGATTTSLTIAAGETLQSLADRINAAGDVGASASVVNDQLVLIAAASGTAGAITVAGSASAALGFTTTQAAQDAAATLNGVALTSADNTLEGAVAGLTLDLAKTGTTTVTVGLDGAAAEKQAKAFVDAYNSLVSTVNAATKYDAASKSAGTLQGDQTITSLGGHLRGIAGSAVSALGGAYDSLARIGISGSRHGALTLDSAAFQAALADDPDAVRAVLGHDDGDGTTGAGDGLARQLQGFAATFSSETLAPRLTGYSDALRRMDDKIAGLEVLMGVKEERLRAQFQAMERAVMQFQSQGQHLTGRLAGM